MTTKTALAAAPGLDPRKFRDPDITADGQRRGQVDFVALETLWFNTGTLCNITCRNCYIESSPRNDRLVYLDAAEVTGFLDEIARERLGTREIGFTGGEPFMNPDIMAMLAACLDRGFRVLVLTNAMRPMARHRDTLLALGGRYGQRLAIRVSIDHYRPALHDLERGEGAWDKMFPELLWLAENGFALRVAGRTCWGESEHEMRTGFARLFASHRIPIDAFDPGQLVLFPEMDATVDVPEITAKCWSLLGVDPKEVMCATSRMVIKRKGASRPSIASCTLLPYEPEFELGDSLKAARRSVKLNHPHCARFCVLGGASCSASACGKSK